MGITDRRYMSESNGSFGAIRGREINAVILLILINVAVWLVWQFATQSSALDEFMNLHFVVQPTGILQYFRIHTLLTSEFSHVDAYHILFNMLFLWYLGRDVEVFYGKNNFIALYVFAGVVSSAAHCGLEFFRGMDTPALGASGAIMGIAVAAAFIDPHKTLRIWGIIPVPLWLLVIIFVLMDFSGTMQHGGDHVAHAAHLGGAFAGLLFYALDLRIFSSRGRSNSGLFNRIKLWWLRRHFRIVERRRETGRESLPDETELVAARRTKPAHAESADRKPAPAQSAKQIDPETARRVDELLAKISREGIGALSTNEREFLKQSSEKYKR